MRAFTEKLLASVVILVIGLGFSAAAPMAILALTFKSVREAWR